MPAITDTPETFEKEVRFTELQNLFSNFRLTSFRQKVKNWLSRPEITFKSDGTPELTNPAGNGQSFLAEASDGTALYSRTAEPSPMLMVTKTFDSGAGGDIGSTELIPAGGTGVKWVIHELRIVGCIIAAPVGSAGCAAFQLSDLSGSFASIAFAGPTGANFKGPQKQATAATAINVSAAAGTCTASSRFTVNVLYRASS